ncbi:hypothetical protein Tco_0924280 [Tanacetum coccineum]|uniref:RNA-directed DNA polymerase, eukaryota, reverse transcriptase zinc-binding domain protein n=1 Tax=Tanacetum coccineum TaxID=301880 RepID=A0ABQ5D3E5_9ASTR
MQALKSRIKVWLAEDNQKLFANKRSIQSRLIELDKYFDQGKCADDLIQERSNLLKDLQDLNHASSLDMFQKAKIRWAIEGDENSKFFHGIINKKRSQHEFKSHFANRFVAPVTDPIAFDYIFPRRLSSDQIDVLGMVLDFFMMKSKDHDKDVVACCLLFLRHSQKYAKALIFKIDFEKAFDSVRWDYLDMVLHNFGFGSKWRSWIKGVSNLLWALFLLMRLSEVASGLKINLLKSKLMGIGIPHNVVVSAARSIGCSVMHTPFNYLGVKVGASMSRICSWDDVVAKLSSRLSKWSFKSVLNRLEAIRRNFFNGVECTEKKLFLISWKKVLASKKNGGLGVSSFFALNRALLFKWIWRFIANGPSLWSRFIAAIHGSRGALDNPLPFTRHSPWLDIVGEFKKLSIKGIDLISLIIKKVGNGEQSYFWDDVWLGDSKFRDLYPRLYLLESAKNASVASKFRDSSLTDSFRRQPRSGIEEEQLLHLLSKTSSVMLPNSNDRWTWSLDSAGIFSVKSARDFIDGLFLPKAAVPTRWVKYIPII